MLERSRETGKGDRQGDPRTDCKKQQRSWWRVGGASGIQPKSSRKKRKKKWQKGLERWEGSSESVNQRKRRGQRDERDTERRAPRGLLDLGRGGRAEKGPLGEGGGRADLKDRLGGVADADGPPAAPSPHRPPLVRASSSAQARRREGVSVEPAGGRAGPQGAGRGVRAGLRRCPGVIFHLGRLIFVPGEDNE